MGERWSIYRSCVTIDTTGVPSNAKISLAELRGTASKGISSVDPYPLHIVEAVHGDEAVPSDYGDLKLKVASLGSIDSDGPFAVSIDTSKIVKGGYTKLAFRIGYDIDNVEPPHGWPTMGEQCAVSISNLNLYLEYSVPEPSPSYPTHPTHPTHPDYPTVANQARH